MDEDTKNTKNTKDNISHIDDNQSEVPVVHYSVMPDLEGIGKPPPPPTKKQEPKKPEPPKPGGAATQPEHKAVKPAEVPVPPTSHKPPPPKPPAPSLTKDLKLKKQKEKKGGGHGGSKRYLLMIGAVVLALVILAGAGYVLYSQNYRSGTEATDLNEDTDQTDQETDEIIPLQDTDSDGLDDQQEANYGTDPNEADTDGDGLADGDEIKLFATNPLSRDTDGDQFDDSEVQGGFDPSIPGDVRLSEEQILTIERAVRNNEVYIITRETLLLGNFWQDRLGESEQQQEGEVQGSSSSGSQIFTYQDPVYGYQLVLPGEWKKSSGSGPTNVVFTEVGSSVARYVQIQAFVGVDNEGNIDNSGIVENEVKRLSNVGMEGVSIKNSLISGKPALRLSAEFKRGASVAGKTDIITSTVEYVIDITPTAFVVTTACSSTTGISCIHELNTLASHIEQNLIF